MNIRKSLSRISIAVATAALLAGAAPLYAQEIAPDQLALARKYIDLTDRAQVFEVAVVRTGLQTMKTLLGQNPEIQEQLDQAISKAIEQYKGRKGELLDQFARVYAARFTVEELQAIVDFYESDIGQKLSKENFEANRQLSAIMSIYQTNLNTDFLAAVRANLKEMGIEL